ncbi:hypothetical protein DFP72DRAFT_776983, partial [Ephemerocybe angulata]
KISTDLKEMVLRMKDARCLPLEDICHYAQVSESTVWRAQRRKRSTGSAAPKIPFGRGRPRLLLRNDCRYLLQLARYRPTTFLDEYAARLEQFRHLPVHLSTIHRSLRRAGLSIKRIQKMAKERDPELRADFVRRIGQYDLVCLISIDEVSKDDRTYTRLWGRA